MYMLLADRKPRYKTDRTEIGPFESLEKAEDYKHHLPRYGAGWKIAPAESPKEKIQEKTALEG